MKKIIIFTICLLLLVSSLPSFAIDDTKTTELPKTLELSLKQAIEYAIKNNKDLKVHEADIKKSKVTYDEEMKKIDKFNKMSPYDKKWMPYIERKKFTNGLIKKNADLALKKSKWNKALRENEIKYNVEKYYYDLLQSKKNLNISKENLELSKKQYEQSKKKFDLGKISHQQLLSMELSLSTAESKYNETLLKYNLTKLDFNKILGIPLTQNIVLTDKIEYNMHLIYKIDDEIKKALEMKPIIKLYEEKYEVERRMLVSIDARYPKENSNYQKQLVITEEIKSDLEKAKVDVKMEIRSSYLRLISSKKHIDRYRLNVQKAEKNLELAELGYKVGESTPNNITKARIDFMNAKKDLAEQIYKYNLALLDFKYSIGIGKNQLP